MIIERHMQDGHIFRQMREDLGLTRKQAAERLGVHPSTISRIESNGSKVSVSRLEKLGTKLVLLDSDGNETTADEFMATVHDKINDMDDAQLLTFAINMGLVTEKDIRDLADKLGVSL